MALIPSKGNMYEWITHQFNPVKGLCEHKCEYCYVRKWGEPKPLRLVESEFKTDLGKDNFIFIVSGADLFAENVPDSWIYRVIDHCKLFPQNKYLLQTKNPHRILEFSGLISDQFTICTTIETNRHYTEMGFAPFPEKRAEALSGIDWLDKYITIEPIFAFDLVPFVDLLWMCKAKQINVGANSFSGIKLPEPNKEQVLSLISEVEKFTKVKQKENLKRLLK